jgi:GntR family transcriptional regulator, galactonate operon transcriptional repressor
MSEATVRSTTADSSQWRARPARLSEPVVKELVDRIVAGQYPEGTNLPIEPELCEMFAVSNTVIREAVKSVESMRLVSIRQGRGTTVRPIADWDLVNTVVLAAMIAHDVESSILDDATDVRVALEGQMAGQAANHATEESLDQMRALLETLHQEINDPASFLVADVAFHEVVMTASGNRLGRAVIRTIGAEASRSNRYMGEPSPDDLFESNRGHDAVFDAIVAHDQATAAKAMGEHIYTSWLRRQKPRTQA